MRMSKYRQQPLINYLSEDKDTNRNGRYMNWCDGKFNKTLFNICIASNMVL